MDRAYVPNLEAELARLRLREAAGRLDVQGWVRSHPGQALLGALAAGFIVGTSPRTVHTLAETLLQVARTLSPACAPREE